MSPRSARKRIRKDASRGRSRQSVILLAVAAVCLWVMMSDRSGTLNPQILELAGPATETKGLLLSDAERMSLHNSTQELLHVTTDAPFELSTYDYYSPANPTKYTLPPPIRTNETTVVIVLSSRTHFDRRAVIRDTWAKSNNNVYFVIGGPEPNNQGDRDLSNPLSVSSILMKEQELYGDIIDSIHPDSYRSLPFKLHFGMKWVVNNLEQVNWVVKADDDQIVRLRLLQFFVLRKFNPDHPSVVGAIVVNAQPHRSGRWAEDPKFKGEYYPPWAFGSAGYIVSRQVAEYIGKHDSLHYYQGEDAGLGIWLAESSLQITWIDTPEVNKDKVCDPRFYIIGHDLTVDEIKGCYDTLGDSIPDRKSIISFAAARKDQHPGKIASW